MNERIKELAEQAAKGEGWGMEVWQATYSEKFAELIVRECIDKAFHNGHPDLEFLLKHFGVE